MLFFDLICGRKLDRIEQKLEIIIWENALMSAELDRLTSEVQEAKTVVDSAVALLGQLAQMIRDLATDPAALNQLADELDAKTAELAAAVTANTPD